jgi:hypothetical protein
VIFNLLNNLDVTDDEHFEDVLGYVDNIALVALGSNFEESTKRLKTMMTKADGGLHWSRDHNSQV